MRIVVIGAGAVGNATAFYLRKHGHDVVVIERQPGAALETSLGNGGVIHASEVEPWSQPGMPRKILSWLTRRMHRCCCAMAPFRTCGVGVWSSLPTAQPTVSAKTRRPIYVWRCLA
jgi:glycine/D-amino acid oxidase-like deaminating enzyme